MLISRLTLLLSNKHSAIPSLAPKTKVMSSMKESGIKVCCSSGKPSATGGCGDYSPTGKLVQLAASGPAAYYTRPKEGPLCSNSALIVIYDIFGIDILQTRRFADLLAERTHRRVVMPDVFRGRPWLLKNFPPKDGGEFIKWVETAGSWDVVSADLKSAHEFLLADGLNSSAPLGILGFCWGGKQAIQACSGDSYARKLGFKFLAGVSLHGAFLGPEDAKHVTVPMLFMPAGDDPDIGPIKVILDKKPFGAQCAYHRFDSETHGFAAARGDWNVPHTREAIMKALDLTAEFFNKHLPN